MIDRYLTYLQDALLVHAHKVERLINEVVTESFQETFHQRQTQSVHTWPAGGVLRLTHKRLRERERERAGLLYDL